MEQICQYCRYTSAVIYVVWQINQTLTAVFAGCAQIDQYRLGRLIVLASQQRQKHVSKARWVVESIDLKMKASPARASVDLIFRFYYIYTTEKTGS